MRCDKCGRYCKSTGCTKCKKSMPKIGDILTVKSKEWFENSIKSNHGSVKCGKESFTIGMSKFCGCKVKVRKIIDDFIFVKEDIDYHWTPEMFEEF